MNEYALKAIYSESGVVVFSLRGGRLSQKGRIEVLLDDAYWPTFSTTRARSLNAQWDHVGEGFIKELDFGRVWLRLNQNDDGEKDDIISEFKCDAKDFLDRALVSHCSSACLSSMLMDPGAEWSD